jgi:Zn-dependent alcohol dehydrogenase
MAGITKTNPAVANIIGELRAWGKEVTMLAVDFNVDADGSTLAMEAALNTISRYGNIVMAGAVYGTGQQVDLIIEGDLAGSDYVSADGTVTGTVAAAMAEDLLNLGTVDGVNFATGTPAVTIKSTLQFA